MKIGSFENYLISSSSSNINELDFKNLRTFYLPFLGTSPSMVYQVLADKFSENKGKLIKNSAFELLKETNLSEEEFVKSLKRLRAVGLVKKYVNPKDKLVLFELKKPLSANKINKNQLISSQLVSKLGFEKFQSIISKNVSEKVNKDIFTEEVVKFYEEFELNSKFNEELQKQKLASNYSDPNNFENDLQKSRQHLDSVTFFQNIVKRNILPSEKRFISSLEKKGFDSFGINAFINFSYEINNGKIILPYIEKIAQSFIKLEIFEGEEVAAELDYKLSAHYYKNEKTNNFTYDLNDNLLLNNDINNKEIEKQKSEKPKWFGKEFKDILLG